MDLLLKLSNLRVRKIWQVLQTDDDWKIKLVRPRTVARGKHDVTRGIKHTRKEKYVNVEYPVSYDLRKHSQ